MKQKLMRVDCGPECGFAIQSHDEKEVINVSRQHVKNAHNMNASVTEIKEMMKAV